MPLLCVDKGKLTANVMTFDPRRCVTVAGLAAGDAAQVQAFKNAIVALDLFVKWMCHFLVRQELYGW